MNRRGFLRAVAAGITVAAIGTPRLAAALTNGPDRYYMAAGEMLSGRTLINTVIIMAPNSAIVQCYINGGGIYIPPGADNCSISHSVLRNCGDGITVRLAA